MSSPSSMLANARCMLFKNHPTVCQDIRGRLPGGESAGWPLLPSSRGRMRGPVRRVDWPLPSWGRVRGPFRPILLALGLADSIPKTMPIATWTPFSPGCTAVLARQAGLINCGFWCFNFTCLAGCVFSGSPVEGSRRSAAVVEVACAECRGVSSREPPNLARGFCLFLERPPCECPSPWGISGEEDGFLGDCLGMGGRTARGSSVLAFLIHPFANLNDYIKSRHKWHAQAITSARTPRITSLTLNSTLLC